jgi:hypothetical protein
MSIKALDGDFLAFRCSNLSLFAGIAVFLLFFLPGGALIKDGDTFWHLSAGLWILENKAIPYVDSFSHTYLGAPWVAHEWLAEVVFALAYGWLSWTGITLVTALAAAISVMLLSRFLESYLQPVHTVILLLLAVGMIQPHMMVRPHALAFPLLMIWFTGLIKAVDQEKAPSGWLLLPLVLWANLHGGASLGVAFIPVLAAQSLWEASDSVIRGALVKRWLAFMVLSLLALCITPQGIHGLLFPFQMLGDSYMLSTIGEWHSPNFHKLQPLEVWVVLLLALALLTRFTIPLTRLLLIVGLLHLSLKHNRNIELLGLISPLLLAEYLKSSFYSDVDCQELERKELLYKKSSMLVMAVVLIVLASLPYVYNKFDLVRLKEGLTAEAALKKVERMGVAGNVFNSYLLGGYMTFKGIPVFIDGRADMYGSIFLEKYVESSKARNLDGFRELLLHYDIRWTILRKNEAVVNLLDLMPGWERIYKDDFVVVHVKKQKVVE